MDGIAGCYSRATRTWCRRYSWPPGRCNTVKGERGVGCRGAKGIYLHKGIGGS